MSFQNPVTDIPSQSYLNGSMFIAGAGYYMHAAGGYA
jgi:hypothetical protein